jgi:hypothetical protein
VIPGVLARRVTDVATLTSRSVDAQGFHTDVHQRHCDGRQRRGDVADGLDVIEARDGDVAAGLNAVRAQPTHGSDRHHVGDREDQLDVAEATAREFCGAVVSAVARERCRHYVVGIDHQSVLGEAGLKAAHTIGRREQRVFIGDGREAGVAEADECACQIAGAAVVVDAHRVERQFMLAHKYRAPSAGLECLELRDQLVLVEPLGAAASRQDDHPGLLPAQSPDKSQLTCGIALGDRHGDDQPGLARARDDAGRDRREEGVGDVSDEERHGGGGALRHGLRREVRGVVEFEGRRVHPFAVLVFHHPAAAVEGAGGGGE